MGDYYIELPFVLQEQRQFPRGSSIFYNGNTFKIKDVVNPDFDSKSGGYKYTLRFWARQNDMKDVRIMWQKSLNKKETTFHDTTDLQSFGNLVADNMNAFEQSENWKVAAVPEDLSVTTKLVSFNGDTVWDALNMIAETFECEWWTVENGAEIWIYFGKLEFGTPEEFKRGEVVSSIPARNGDNTDYGTRFYAFGSTRNIPDYYDDTEQGGVTNHVSEKRLHLPDGIQYVDAWEPLAKNDIVEQVVFFDDIYPKSTETVSSIETIDRKVENVKEGEDDVFDAYVMVCNDTLFVPSDVMKGETLKCVFTSGVFNGREFELALIKDNSSHTVIDPEVWKPEDGFNKKFEIIAQQEELGVGEKPLIIPNKDLHPEVGDTFILTGIELPKGRILAAENELLDAAKAWALKNSSDTTVYDCPTNPVYCTRHDKNYDLGQKVLLVDARFGDSGRLSRIQAYEKTLYNEYMATYTVGDNTAYSRLGEIEKSIASSAYAERAGVVSGVGIYLIRSSYDATLPTDSNTYSAKASDKRFLNQLTGGTVKGTTTFEKGVQIGKDFAAGITGYGANVDANGNAELESLFVRRFLEVPELRYNRIDVEVGDKWNAAGMGIVESVTIDADEEGRELPSGTIVLKLEEGEIGAVAVDDICMGIFHNAIDPASNATENSDDGKGNFTFAGFSTVYFRITEILDAGVNSLFRYVLRPVGETWKHSHHPESGMHFVAYGNFTNIERQTSYYQARDYWRFLRNVNNWEFTAANVAMHFGNMEKMSVFRNDVGGYSGFMDNVYMTGRIRQFTSSGAEIPTINDRGVWSKGKTYYKDDDVYHDNAKWRCLTDNTTSEPSKDNPDWLLLEEAISGKDGVSYTENLLSNGKKRTEIKGLGYAGHVAISDVSMDFVQGETYTISGKTNAVWSGDFNPEKGAVSLSCRASNKIVTLTGADMSSDGTTGHTFVWEEESVTIDFLSVGYTIDAAADVWIEEIKIEKGRNAHTVWTPAAADMGQNGMIIRQSEWLENIEYHNDADKTDTPRYLDVVLVRNNSKESVTGWDMYTCKRTHVSSLETAPATSGGDAYWDPANELAPIITPIVIAKNSVINFMQGNKLLIQDENQKVIGGFVGEEFPLFIGATYEDRESAPFMVSQKGKLIADNADITGKITATEGEIGGFKISKTDLVASQTSNGMSFVPECEMRLSVSLISFIEGPKNSCKSKVNIGTNTAPAGTGINICPAYIEVNGSSDQYISTLNNIGIYLSVEGMDDSFKDSYENGVGNHALNIVKGDIRGFRLYTRRINSSTTLSLMDSIILFYNTATITITLPTGAEEGQLFICHRCNSASVTYRTTGNARLRQKTTTSTSLNNTNAYTAILVYDKSNDLWIYTSFDT